MKTRSYSYQVILLGLGLGLGFFSAGCQHSTDAGRQIRVIKEHLDSSEDPGARQEDVITPTVIDVEVPTASTSVSGGIAGCRRTDVESHTPEAIVL